MTGSHLRV